MGCHIQRSPIFPFPWVDDYDLICAENPRTEKSNLEIIVHEELENESGFRCKIKKSKVQVALTSSFDCKSWKKLYRSSILKHVEKITISEIKKNACFTRPFTFSLTSRIIKDLQRHNDWNGYFCFFPSKPIQSSDLRALQPLKPYLQEIFLKRERCSIPHFKKLISNLNSLKTFTIDSNKNPGLYLKILSTNCPHLTSLTLKNCSIDLQKFKKYIFQFTKLKKIKLVSRDPIDSQIVLDICKNCKEIRHLICFPNKGLNDDILQRISQFVCLKTFKMASFKGVSLKGLSSLNENCQQLASIAIPFDCSKNMIDYITENFKNLRKISTQSPLVSIENLLRLVKNSPSLKKLTIGNSELDLRSLEFLLAKTKYSPKIKLENTSLTREELFTLDSDRISIRSYRGYS